MGGDQHLPLRRGRSIGRRVASNRLPQFPDQARRVGDRVCRLRVVAPVDVTIRRVGFRSGTDAELSALHAVEIPIAAEIRSNRMPRPIDSYMAFARNLPSQFADHAWLAETAEGAPVACGFCWSNAAGDQRVMQCDLAVRRD